MIVSVPSSFWDTFLNHGDKLRHTEERTPPPCFYDPLHKQLQKCMGMRSPFTGSRAPHASLPDAGPSGTVLSPLVLVSLLLFAGYPLRHVFFATQRVFGTLLMPNLWPSASCHLSFCGNMSDLLIGLRGCEWRRSIELGSIWRSASSSLPREMKARRENLQGSRIGRPPDLSTILVAQRDEKDTVGTLLATASPAHPWQEDTSCLTW